MLHLMILKILTITAVIFLYGVQALCESNSMYIVLHISIWLCKNYDLCRMKSATKLRIRYIWKYIIVYSKQISFPLKYTKCEKNITLQNMNTTYEYMWYFTYIYIYQQHWYLSSDRLVFNNTQWEMLVNKSVLFCKYKDIIILVHYVLQVANNFNTATKSTTILISLVIMILLCSRLISENYLQKR